MFPQAAGLEQRLGDLETQIERLTLALLRWRESEEHRQPSERRLAQLTEQCADVLKHWTATSERHAHAVGELESRLVGWDEIENRLQHDASSRFQGLERTIAREWASLRELHEEPVRELREQAETLTEISVTAAGSAQTGLERAEARLATLEHDLHRRIDELSRDIHAVLAEVRHRGVPALGPASSWSLDEVTRLHHELRDGGASAGSLPTILDATPQSSTTSFTVEVPPPHIGSNGDAPRPVREAAVDVAAVEPEDEPVPAEQQPAWKRYAPFAGLALATVIVAGFALSFYGRANRAAEQAAAAQQKAEQIAAAATERIEAARKDAAAQISQARDAASKAQVTTDVLAASDLIRFNLVGGDGAGRLSAQLLWSRARGLVFSAARIPPPAANAVYQIWLLTAGEPVSAGTFVPDASGRVTLATDTPPTVPRPIVGVRVTLESAAGHSAPAGATVLARVQ